MIELQIVSLPEYVPALIDERFGPFPFVSASRSGDTEYFFVGMSVQFMTRISRLLLVGQRNAGALSAAESFTLDQLLLVVEMADELRAILSPEELEGWRFDLEFD